MAPISTESQNYAKLIAIVLGEGAKALKIILHKFIQSRDQTFEAFFDSFLDENTLKDLQKKGYHRKTLKDKNIRRACDFDISFLFDVISILYDTEDWDWKLRESGVDLFAESQKIKVLRNDLVHQSPAIKTDLFLKKVTEMKECVEAIGGDTSVIEEWQNAEFSDDKWKLILGGFGIWIATDRTKYDQDRSIVGITGNNSRLTNHGIVGLHVNSRETGGTNPNNDGITGLVMKDQSKFKYTTDEKLNMSNVIMEGSSQLNIRKSRSKSVSSAAKDEVQTVYPSPSLGSISVSTMSDRSGISGQTTDIDSKESVDKNGFGRKTYREQTMYKKTTTEKSRPHNMAPSTEGKVNHQHMPYKQNMSKSLPIFNNEYTEDQRVPKRLQTRKTNTLESEKRSSKTSNVTQDSMSTDQSITERPTDEDYKRSSSSSSRMEEMPIQAETDTRKETKLGRIRRLFSSSFRKKRNAKKP